MSDEPPPRLTAGQALAIIRERLDIRNATNGETVEHVDFFADLFDTVAHIGESLGMTQGDNHDAAKVRQWFDDYVANRDADARTLEVYGRRLRDITNPRKKYHGACVVCEYHETLGGFDEYPAEYEDTTGVGLFVSALGACAALMMQQAGTLPLPWLSRNNTA